MLKHYIQKGHLLLRSSQYLIAKGFYYFNIIKMPSYTHSPLFLIISYSTYISLLPGLIRLGLCAGRRPATSNTS